VIELSEKVKITKKELNKAINKLKNRKATGPDNIPNEALKKMNPTNRGTTLEILNMITDNQQIPKQWLTNTITRFYKGKGTKGKCSSERGITLSSNIGKLYERIINERVTESINITDAQAGGRKHRSTIDHIATRTTAICTR